MSRNGTNKTRTSITIDPDIKGQIDEMPHVTLSGLVNETAREFVSAGKNRRNGLEIRKERLEAEIKELEHDLEKKRETLEEIQETLEKRDNNTDEVFEDAVVTVAETIQSNLENKGKMPSTDNPAVQAQAKKASVPPQEILDEAKERVE